MDRVLDISWHKVPSGTFTMGIGSESDILAAPQHAVFLPAYFISESPITNAQYRLFVSATAYPTPGHWLGGRIPAGLDDHPVTYVDWHDACAFCAWAGCRLPTEAEWEKAARGVDGRRYPWGDEAPTSNQANFAGGIGTTTPVGSFASGASPYGLQDMAGNVMEWTNSHFLPYPLPTDTVTRGAPLVLRGGAYLHSDTGVRCTTRHTFFATARDEYIGFRVARGSDKEPEHRQSESTLLPVPVTSSLPTDRCPLPFEWVTIPEGPFLMGSGDSETDDALFDEETPQHRVSLPSFGISRTPVTNAQYHRFVEGAGYPSPGHWLNGHIPDGLDDHPVTYVDWYDACAFCAWAGCRFPTEAEWEKAARGVDGRRYPWGDQAPGPLRTRFAAASGETTTPVLRYPSGASPYGVYDMTGNVWEWVHSLYRPYPYSPEDGREDAVSRDRRVLRGGSFLSPDARYLRCAARSRSYPVRRRDHIGFRVAKANK